VSPGADGRRLGVDSFSDKDARERKRQKSMVSSRPDPMHGPDGLNDRRLAVVADDFGIGPETTRGILELAKKGVVTATLLMCNSPYAPEAVRAHRAAGRPCELGWHPCLTQDPPCAPLDQVRSLVNPAGCLWPLPKFLTRLHLGCIRHDEIVRELTAQLERFLALVGQPPGVIAAHQHLTVFPPIATIFIDLLLRYRIRPYVRRVQEPINTLLDISGARPKRLLLTLLGRLQARQLDLLEFPGNEVLGGITDPKHVDDPEFFVRWLNHLPGNRVELMVHPGYYDHTLFGRDCFHGDELIRRRVAELELLKNPKFLDACRDAGFRLVSPSQWTHPVSEGVRHAA
jgi:hypothetical protein